MTAERDFPSTFLWGSATSAHRVEGNNRNNDWWEWEHRSLQHEKSGDAIDHWNRYPQDLALLKELGHNAYRFSLEWSRIEPEPGSWSADALDHYDRLLDCVHGYGLTPLVTLHHFTLPLWFAERGGWRGPGAVETFCEYVSAAAERLGDRMPLIATINEPQVLALMGYALGLFPPQHHSWEEAEEVNRTLLDAHVSAVAVLRQSAPESRIGLCLQLPVLEARRPGNLDDQYAAARVRRLVIDEPLDFLRSATDTGDWVGVQYYTRYFVDGTADLPSLTGPPAGTETSMMGWELYPKGLGENLRTAARVGLPMLVTENGIATADDDQRVRYVMTHLAEVRDAMSEGIDVQGWFHWSAFDNFEWSSGWGPTFGMVEVLRDDDQRRIPRPSAHAMAAVFGSGNLSELEAPSAARQSGWPAAQS